MNSSHNKKNHVVEATAPINNEIRNNFILFMNISENLRTHRQVKLINSMILTKISNTLMI